MSDGEITLGELPAIDDVSIQNKYIGSDAFEVVD
jgi:hypothetical protein